MRADCVFFLVITCCSAAFGQTPVTYRPLTASERWHRYWKDTIVSPGLYFAAVGAASGSQIGNDPPEWGQGVQGYAKRSASLLGIFAMQETIHQGGAATCGYDPRYLRCNCEGFFRRSGHALAWTLLTKNNAGQTRIDVPTVAAAYGSGMLSMYWYPARYSPLTDGVRVGTQQLGFAAGINVLREFGPEVKKLLKVPHRSRATEDSSHP